MITRASPSKNRTCNFHRIRLKHPATLQLKFRRTSPHNRSITHPRNPHTIARPLFRAIKRVTRDVESVAKKYDLVDFKLSGFGYFNSPGGKVIYADIKPSKELDELRWELAKKLRNYVRLKEWERRERLLFHATITFKDIDRKFSKIWSYLKRKEKSDINQQLLRITIIGNGGRIVCEYDLMLKRLLDRRDALSGKVWKRTIFMFRVKLLRRRFLATIGRLFGRS